MMPEYALGLIIALGAWLLAAFLMEVCWGSQVGVFYPEIGTQGEIEPFTRLAPREFWGRFVPLLLPLAGGLALLIVWAEPWVYPVTGGLIAGGAGLAA